MKTETKRIFNPSTQKIYKSITIYTDKDEIIFEGKLYSDQSQFSSKIDENELKEELSKIYILLSNQN